MKKLFGIALLLLSGHLNANGQQFRVSYPQSVFNKPFSGRVFLYLHKENRNPKDEMLALGSFPCFSKEVRDIQPGATIVFDDRADSYPVKLSDIERGLYYVQAVWDRNLGGRTIGESEGNLFSASVKADLTKDTALSFEVICDQVVPVSKFVETDAVKELSVTSALLSRFYGMTKTLNAAVQLPREYYKYPNRQFPVVYSVSGFGGDYHRLSGDSTKYSPMLDTVPCITVYLDGNCPGGHSVYANSDNNGPWGDALVKELIPLVDQKFRSNGARLLWGHSSGGWTVLWLQAHYPKVFVGCWSSSPDPVDFRAFQKVDLYKDSNMFYDKNGKLQQAFTVAAIYPITSMKRAYQQEYVVSRGEQMHSFDYVFSEKGPNGLPVKICDPVSGAIDKKCLEHWKQYDISVFLKKNWSLLQKDLTGKVRISVGDRDNFLLHHAVHLLEEDMKTLQKPFVFAYYPGDHFTINMPEYISAGYRFLRDRYLDYARGKRALAPARK
jgi:S-formylglutathione hydrolase FrmB